MTKRPNSTPWRIRIPWTRDADPEEFVEKLCCLVNSVRAAHGLPPMSSGSDDADAPPTASQRP